MDKAGWGLVIVSLSCPTGVARAADAIPFFKADPKPVMYGPVPLFVPERKPVMYGPVLPDPGAPECGIDDQACLERHDGRVLSLASSSHARQECAESTHPERCYEAFDMMEGDFVPKPDPILSDPCAWVVLVDHQVATLSSKKMGITKRVLNRGWKARTFIGACNVNSVVPMQPAAVIPLPAWTVRKGPSVQAAAAPRPATIVIPVAVNAAAVVGTTPVAMRPAPAVQVPPALAPTTPSEPPASPTPPAPPAPTTSGTPAVPAAPPSPPTASPAGASGTTQPPPFARPPAVSDAQSGPVAPPR